jgi:HSP20 family molecular chaperone IbpA
MAGQQPTFKSELYIPVKQDTQSFEQRQKSIWDDMNTRLNERRRLWETEVEQMRRDLFRLAPTDPHDLFAMPLAGAGGRLGGSPFDDIFADMTNKLSGGGTAVSGDHTLHSKPMGVREGHLAEPIRSGGLAEPLPVGHIDAEKKRFVLSFDVSNFSPEEISVRTDEHKLIVNARHTEQVDGRTINRQFSREGIKHIN